MKFILREIKLWFKNDCSIPKSYLFEANKINVISGDSSTGKSTIWCIVDYCLLSSKVQIPDTIVNAVSWFGIRFSIDGHDISIARKSPEKNVIAKDLYFSEDCLPEEPCSNKSIQDVMLLLNKKFNISDDFTQAFFKGFSFRHFLIFSSLTEEIIAQPDIYFDKDFYSEDYDKNTKISKIHQIFKLIIGAISVSQELELQSECTKEKLITRKVKELKSNCEKNQALMEKFRSQVKLLVEECKNNNFINPSQSFENEDEAIAAIEQIVSIAKNKAENNYNPDEDEENLHQKKSEIISEIAKLSRYKKEYDVYKKNLNKSADSLQPIEFLNKNLLNQLVNSYETQVFLQSLADSLFKIKQNINQQSSPLDVTEDLNRFKQQLKEINNQIEERDRLSNKLLHDKKSFILIGNIDARLKELLNPEEIKKIVSDLSSSMEELTKLDTEKKNLFEKSDIRQLERIKLEKIRLLDMCIQNIYEQFNLVSSNAGYNTTFDIEKLQLKILSPENENSPLLPISKMGSKANYLFLHLSMYLGLHMHMINENIHFIPQIIFIDQPSLPFLKSKKDQEMLQTIFHVLNSFIDTMVIKNKTPFQIILTEHALPSDWEKLPNFILLDEFIDGNALIPNELI